MKDQKVKIALISLCLSTLVLFSLIYLNPHHALITIGSHTRRFMEHRETTTSPRPPSERNFATKDNTQCRWVASPYKSYSDLVWRVLLQGGLCEPSHLCEFGITTGTCRHKTTPSPRLSRQKRPLPLSEQRALTSTNVSDSDQDHQVDAGKLVQPFLKPTEWFLSDVEIQASRGGVPRTGLETYTSGNVVEPYATGRQTMDDMYKDLQATRAGDFIYLAGWGMNDVEMLPPDDSTSLNKLLRRACERGVEMRFMIWANAIDAKPTREMYRFVNEELAPVCLAHGGLAVMIVDNRVSILKTASHHQKTLSLTVQGELITYLGGIDIMVDRWDTITHDNVEFRKSNFLQRLFNGWVDGHQRIVGPAGQDVYQNFVTRWNDPTPLSPTNWFYKKTRAVLNPVRKGMSWFKKNILRKKNVKTNTVQVYENGMTYPLIPLRVINTPTSTESESEGSHVQIVRTFQCDLDAYEAFAPKGEFSILQSRLKAIHAARNYIFIEDQYFIYVPELLAALLEVLPRLERLVVVVQTIPDSTKKAGYEAYQYKMVQPLLQAFPDKVKFYTTQNDVYVHSKLIIIDDVYISIGTSNWNMRSMTLDSEITANTVGAALLTSPDGLQVTRLGNAYRVEKIAEAGRFKVEEVTGKPLLEALDMLEQAATDPDKLLGFLEVEDKPYFRFYGSITQGIVDADGRCEHSNRRTAAQQCEDVTWLTSQSALNQAFCRCHQDSPDTMSDCMNGPAFGPERHLQMVQEADEEQVARSLLTMSAWSIGLGAVVLAVGAGVLL